MTTGFKKSARIISQAKVDAYDKKLTDAALRCLAQQRVKVNHTLHAAGVTGSLVAAGKKKKKAGAAVAAGAVVVPFAWSQANWNKLVNTELGPDAQDVVADAVAEAQGAFGDAVVMGAATAAAALVAGIIANAIGVGQGIGDRVDNAALGATGDGDILFSIQSVFDTAGSILSNAIGSMGQAVANQAELDQANAVIAYNAPTYLSATKTWNTQEDDRVRPDHEEVDGAEVAINDTFSVGDEDMTGPGDSSASAEQTEGCRCWLTYDGLVPAGTEDQFEDETQEQGLERSGALG
jgi:hypothetical protein